MHPIDHLSPAADRCRRCAFSSNMLSVDMIHAGIRNSSLMIESETRTTSELESEVERRIAQRARLGRSLVSCFHHDHKLALKARFQGESKR